MAVKNDVNSIDTAQVQQVPKGNAQTGVQNNGNTQETSQSNLGATNNQTQNVSLDSGFNANAVKNLTDNAFKSYYQNYAQNAKNGLTGILGGQNGASNMVTSDMLSSIWSPDGADEQYLSGYYNELAKKYSTYTPQQAYYALTNMTPANAVQLLQEWQTGYDDYVAAEKKKVEDAKIAADREASKQVVLDKYLTDNSDLIRQQYAADQEQIANNLDYQTALKQRQARYAYEDAIADYTKQYRAKTAQMYNGMDNAALASRAAGQYGGTATQKVNAVQSEYQQARQELALQQNKLATDTMREVEDLRAQGEFDKADQLMKSRQQEFQALYEEANRVNDNEYNAYVQQNTWDREDAQIQRDQEQKDKEWKQQLGMYALNAGMMPTEDMLKAMGIDMATAALYISSVG